MAKRKPGQQIDKVDKEDMKVEFLKNYAACGVLRATTTKMGLTNQTVHAWLRDDEAFNEAFQKVKEAMLGKLELEATNRALAGSDSLLMFMLKAQDPQMYNPSFAIKASAGDGQAQVIVQFSRDILTDEEVDMLEQKLKPENNEGSGSLRSEPDAKVIPQIKG